MTIAFTKVVGKFGWLGNMSPHPVKMAGVKWRTAEHAFQALRLPVGHPFRNYLNTIKSPLFMKHELRKHRKDFLYEECSYEDVEIMRWVTEEKLIQNKLRSKLRLTEGQLIVEDVSLRNRGNNLFWGAAFIDGEWVGENQLGKLWMEHRDQFCS